jgi:hypothetical protein
VTIQTVYRILVSRGPTTATSAGAIASDPNETRTLSGQLMPVLTDSVSRQLSILPILGAVVGLSAAVVVLVVASLWGRVHDELPYATRKNDGPQPVLRDRGGVTVPEETGLADVRSKV